MSKGRVRCPWHGACFNISTGDIEDFPGLDSLPRFQVRTFVPAAEEMNVSMASAEVWSKYFPCTWWDGLWRVYRPALHPPCISFCHSVCTPWMSGSPGKVRVEVHGLGGFLCRRKQPSNWGRSQVKMGSFSTGHQSMVGVRQDASSSLELGRAWTGPMQLSHEPCSAGELVRPLLCSEIVAQMEQAPFSHQRRLLSCKPLLFVTLR